MMRDSFAAPAFAWLGAHDLARRILIAAAAGLVALAFGAAIIACILKVPLASPTVAQATTPLPLLPQMASNSLDRPARPFINPPSLSLAPEPDDQPQARPAISSLLSRPAPPSPAKPVFSPSIEPAPLPPRRPADLASPNVQVGSVMRLPEAGAASASLGGAFGATGRYDRFTAVYDLTAHTVYLPDGTKLEAHSGLGDRLDDPHHVDEHDRGATPPHLYDLTLREELFHGVQALRLSPVGGGIFGRAGLLAHTYMLGPTGESNGCVSFKNYDAFLQAYQSGQVKHLAVVASLN
jgi:Protein of unknown function (DUF2778)